MKHFRKLITTVILLTIVIFVVSNLWGLREEGRDRPYIVEISRIMDGLTASSQAELDAIDYSQYKYVKKIILCEDSSQLTADSRLLYCIKEKNEKIYRFEYEQGNIRSDYLLRLNLALGIMAFIMLAVLIYVDLRIVRPFHTLESVPYELSKGNLSPDIREDKSKYFGKFVWGMNMLRENIEERRENELSMHRDKKLLMLSLTHDIKTPLSVIKLNAQAISKGLFSEPDRIKQAAEAIDNKVNEIEAYVSQMTEASREDFLDLQVKEEEFYLKDVVEPIEVMYKAKLDLQKIDFEIEGYSNCILYGDKNRLIEVLQNLLENAIKYGDGHNIRIDFGREEDCCLINVINSGASLDRTELDKLFDSFFRGSNASKQKGSGLGLYICKQLMRKMNGDIFVKQSEADFTATVVVRM